MQKFTKVGFFHTPKDFKEIENWIQLHTSEERPSLYTAAYMMYNLMVDLTREDKDEEDI